MSTDFKPNILEWIEEEAINATRRGLKTLDLYNKILRQLRQFDGPITDLKTLKLVKHVGAKTADQLRKKIVSHCNEQNRPVPRGFMEESEKHRIDMEEFTHNLDMGSNTRGPPSKKARKSSSGTGKTKAKEQIAQAAAPYSDRSFTNNPGSKEYYSAWSSINTILKHELVGVTGRSPKIYYLTEEGKVLAEQLKRTVGIASSPITDGVDLGRIETSFDNGVRFESSFDASFDASFDGSSPIMPLSSSPIRRINNPAHNNKYIQQVLGNKGKNPAPPNGVHHHDARNRTFDGVRYEIWRKEDYDVVLYIDNREVRSQQERDHFQARLKMLNINCQVLPLASGDTIWVAQNRSTKMVAVLNYLCERKRLDDLCDSIKDGRFQEQKSRMKKTGIKHCYYLVEEMLSFDNKVAISLKFKDIDETTAFLASNTAAIESFKSDLVVLKPNDIKNQEHYLDVLTKFRNKFEATKQGYECVHLFGSFQDTMGKTNSMTVKEMYMLMLLTIKGLSLEKAIVIQRRFPTPKSLLEFYHTENANAPEDYKKKLMMTEFKDQVGNKKIGGVLLERIYEVWGK
ncbi:Crossover junction endonuclease MUS81 [Candida viswanathii]|uniref:Crossover junction endonuclease MUS81 n=1 Tax=Candida viswanathii TaxID=5486 RepID=A0A367XY05_9ASCO|nr:Crossover junction endonuclease MUS81 [Candida viswanathii]